MRMSELFRAEPRRVAVAAICGLLAAIILAGLVSVFLSERVERVTDEALRHDIELESRANDLRVAVLDLRYHHRNLVIAGPSRGGIEDFEEAYRAVQGRISRLEDVGVRDPEAPRPRQLRETAREYYSGFRPAIDEYDSDPQAFTQVSDRGFVRLDGLDSAVREIQAMSAARSEAALERVEAASRTAQLVLLVVIGGLLLIGAFLAYAAVRRVGELRALYARERTTSEKLVESESRYRRTFENAAVGISHFGLDGKFLRVNSKLCEMVGYTREELLATDWMSISRPDEIDLNLDLRERHLRGETESYSLEKRYIHKDGHEVWINLTASLMRGESGEPLYYIAFIEDISARKQIEDALRESEERYRLLFESNPHPAWVYDLETLSFLAVNEAAVRNYGYSREEFLAMTIEDIRPVEDVPELLDRTALPVQGTEEAGVWRHRKRDGTIIDVEITTRTLVFGNRHAKLVLANDIIERSRAEEERERLLIREKEARERQAEYAALLDTILETAPIGIAFLDTGLRFLRINDSLAAINCIPAEEHLGRTLYEVAPELEYATGPFFRRVLETGEPVVDVEVSGESPREPGRMRHSLAGYYPVRGAEDQILGVGCVVVDITDRKEAEEELARSLRSKTDFLEDVSHELRTPLTTIRTNAEVGLQIERDCAHIRLLEEIAHGSARMSRLVQDLLFLARSDSDSPPLEPETVAVAPFLSEVAARAESVAKGRGSSLVANLKGGGRLRVDPTRVEQAILILVDNAAKYSPADGRVTLSAATGDGELCIRVEDRGPGIPEADLPRIFERFYRGEAGRPSQGGLGLGLAIASAIVKAHGGRINAASRPEEGTVMTLRLPLLSTSQRVGTNSRSNGSPSYT